MGLKPETRKFLRHALLSTLNRGSVFHLVENSKWRRERLLILCYHGVSLEDEHEWWPALFVSPQHLERRLEILKKGNYVVLPLGESLERLYRKDLPPRSVAITFDDGTYDFYRQAYPRLKQHEFPVTVYLSSYYSNYQRPVFKLICLYMMWKTRHRGTADLAEFNASGSVALASIESRQHAAAQIVQWTESQNLTGQQKDEVAAALARRLGIDYPELCRKRILQLMNRQEVSQLADDGADFQLHTHRHRTPLNEELFRREIHDNRDWIKTATGKVAKHFCYPSGVYRPEFLPWLSAEQVISATTCDTALATRQQNPMLLPRLVDTTGRTELEFQSWLNGVGDLIANWKRALLPEK
jgi:peptidoglycan/xylan/chitin deacetylase (PgdA/CDA1 family)